jgi:hypothetical protein
MQTNKNLAAIVPSASITPAYPTWCDCYNSRALQSNDSVRFSQMQQGIDYGIRQNITV